MEDIFYTITFKQVLLTTSIILYVFVVIAVLIKLFVKSDDIEDLPEDDGSAVEQIFGVHSYNQEQEEGLSPSDSGFQQVEEQEEDDDEDDDYSSMMEDLTKNIIDGSEDDPD